MEDRWLQVEEHTLTGGPFPTLLLAGHDERHGLVGFQEIPGVQPAEVQARLEQIRAGEWDRVAELMLSSSRKLASAGADFLICPDNTIHQAFDRVASESPLPWIHIAEPVTSRAREKELKKLLIMGTEFLMSGPVYPDFLSKAGIAFEIPDDEDRRLINNIIFNELVNGIFTSESRAYFDTVIHFMKDRGCDGVVMGCTEIPLLLDPAVSPLPLLDSTRLLAEAAVREALRED